VVGLVPMSEQQWSTVDQFIGEHLLPRDEALEATLASSAASGLPAIQVSPPQGKLLHLLARAQGAKTILEIGTLGGYSAIWLARALPPDGKLITLEVDPKAATVARANIGRAGLGDRVDLRLAPALDTLPRLADERCGPFDLVFIDADKRCLPEYFTWAMRLGRPGTMIIVDNVVRKGAITEDSADLAVQGVRQLYQRIAREPRVSATAIQTVGSKGYDGFLLAVINGT
jgi:predicted O-methyltransferase YrrM